MKRAISLFLTLLLLAALFAGCSAGATGADPGSSPSIAEEAAELLQFTLVGEEDGRRTDVSCRPLVQHWDGTEPGQSAAPAEIPCTEVQEGTVLRLLFEGAQPDTVFITRNGETPVLLSEEGTFTVQFLGEQDFYRITCLVSQSRVVDFVFSLRR